MADGTIQESRDHFATGSLEVSTKIRLLLDRREAAYAVPKKEWKRIRRAIEELEELNSRYDNAAWACVGFGVSFALAGLSVWTTSTSVPAWVIPFLTLGSVFSFVLSLLCFMMVDDRKKAIARNKEACLALMDDVERGFDVSASEEVGEAGPRLSPHETHNTLSQASGPEVEAEIGAEKEDELTTRIAKSSLTPLDRLRISRARSALPQKTLIED